MLRVVTEIVTGLADSPEKTGARRAVEEWYRAVFCEIIPGMNKHGTISTNLWWDQ
jgi:hypothetical protein